MSSCYQEKFGIPRQPGLVTEAKAKLYLLREFDKAGIARGLDAFSHIWITFVFHQNLDIGWKPMVRPPRLGGNQKVGVFASRSGFRPNPIGLSVVKLDKIEKHDDGVVLHLSGSDLLDQTPVLDIKPYIAYADAVNDARSGYASEPPVTSNKVFFSDIARQQCKQKSVQLDAHLATLIEQVLSQDPRPAYRCTAPDSRVYAMKLYDFDLRWRYTTEGIEVIELA